MTSKKNSNNPFGSFSILTVDSKKYGYYRLEALTEQGITDLSRLPFSTRVLLESLLRNVDGFEVHEENVRRLATWNPKGNEAIDIPFKPGRVLLQDFTGVPAVVDLAAMRSAMNRLGGAPKRINPLIPVDLVVDHSVQTDFAGTSDAFTKNLALEFERNSQRYQLLKWAQNSLSNFRVIPPAVGIIHQVNLEYLAPVVMQGESNDSDIEAILYPDSVVGTDSHTVMINGLGVVGWGVGGIEAEAVMLGQPYYMLVPDVVGVELIGTPDPAVTATDIVLTLTERLRKEGVVGKFIEFFGEGATTLPVADRAVLANMAPEYGATMGFFPVDQQTCDFLLAVGRSPDQVRLVEQYMKAQHLFRNDSSPKPEYSNELTLDLATVVPSLAGPKRPQDRVGLSKLKKSFESGLIAPVKDRGFGLNQSQLTQSASLQFPDGEKSVLEQGSVVIASITSCTNTSNPRLMIAAGLLAQKAVERGMKVPPFVKTSLGPGSRVVTDYLRKANLLEPLEALGFHVVGYGCLTCIGNSGPLTETVSQAITDNDLVVASVLSGNRNFEGRVHPLVRANYLAGPPLVVAFALAGKVTIDLTREPIGVDSQGKPVLLADIFPTPDEIDRILQAAVDPQLYRTNYETIYESSPLWNDGGSIESELFPWDETSTYIQEPPFLQTMQNEVNSTSPICDARVLLLLGDSVTTDHISPAGSIKPNSPAGKFLTENGVEPVDFNSYGSRRGNDRVMTRGTFANIRIRNQLVPGTEGGVTLFFNKGEAPVEMSVYDAAIAYDRNKTPLVVIAGKEYGTGSSRDWAAKGTALLGVRAVLAESFERIHRGNLVGMGVLPLEFLPGQNAGSLGLDGTELYTIEPITADFQPRNTIRVKAIPTTGNNQEKEFDVRVRIDTPVELVYYLSGGIMQTVLRKLFD